MKNINKANLEKTGVYQIRNLINGKVYIGSTTMSFEKRMSHHLNQLKRNNHKNRYLQNAWNKHGEDNFIFEILKTCNIEDCLKEEQIYLDLIKFKYNINPLATGAPNKSQETIKRRNTTFKKTVSEAAIYYNKFKSDKIKYDEIPEQYKKMVNAWNNNIPWNKGKSYKSTAHLKVPKTITTKVLEKQKNMRKLCKKVEVFDSNNNSLGVWDNAYELEKFSKSDLNNLPVVSRFKASVRMGVPFKHLQYVNIIKACRTKKPYKGLFMYYLPSV